VYCYVMCSACADSLKLAVVYYKSDLV